MKYHLEKAKEHAEANAKAGIMGKLIKAYKAAAGLLFGQFIIFLVTFSVFPGLTNKTTLTFIDDKNYAWLVLTMVITFNLFDTIGRYSAGYSMLQIPKIALLILIYCRVVFIGTFYLVSWKSQPHFIFASDWFKLLNMALFALTNGYCTTLGSVYAPAEGKDDEKEQIGTLIGLNLGTGILGGAFVALGLGYYVPAAPLR